MSAIELTVGDGDTHPFQPDDEFYAGTFIEIPLDKPDTWDEVQINRGYYLDWYAAQVAFWAYPQELNSVRGIDMARMEAHNSVYRLYSDRPTDRERANASKVAHRDDPQGK